MKWQRRYDLEVDNIECIWVEIFFVSSKSILICIAYKPPESSTYLDNNFATKFNEMLEVGVNENKETIIAGDLNCNYLIKNDQREIKDALRLNGFKQVIDRPTRITATSKTLIDIIATTHPNRIERSIVEANSLSDHDVTGVVRKLHCVKFKPIERSTVGIIPNSIYLNLKRIYIMPLGIQLAWNWISIVPGLTLRA